MRDVLLDRRTRERGLIDTAAVEHLLDAHRDGHVAGGDAIWALLNLELWYRTFIDGDGMQTLSCGRTPSHRRNDRIAESPIAESREDSHGMRVAVFGLATSEAFPRRSSPPMAMTSSASM